MMSFRDMTFCAATLRCADNDCPRRWTAEQEAAARRWWGGEGAPVAFADFSGRDCFVSPEQPTAPTPGAVTGGLQAEPHSGEPKQTPAPAEEGE